MYVGLGIALKAKKWKRNFTLFLYIYIHVEGIIRFILALAQFATVFQREDR